MTDSVIATLAPVRMNGKAAGVKFDPGERQAWHKHDLPYVIVPMTKGKNIMYFEDGRERKRTRRLAACFGAKRARRTNC